MLNQRILSRTSARGTTNWSSLALSIAKRAMVTSALIVSVPIFVRAQTSTAKTGASKTAASAASPKASPGQNDGSSLALITGRLLGSNNKPMSLAYVRVRQLKSFAPDGGPEVALARTNDDGTFSVATSVSGGIILELSGSQHVEQQLPLRVYPGFRLNVDARLPRVKYRAKIDSVRVVGDFNGFQNDSSARLLQLQRDGIWTLDIPSKNDSVVYALVGVTSRGSNANTSSAHDILTANGDYRSVAIARAGSARVEFDLARLIRDTLPFKYIYTGGAEARAARIGDSIQAHNTALGAAERDKRVLDSSFWNPIVRRATHELAVERAALVREMLLFELLNVSYLGGRVPPSIGRLALRELPTTSPAWRTVTSLLNDLSNEAMVVADSVGDILRTRTHRVPSASDSVRLRKYARHAIARTDSMIAVEQFDTMRAQLIMWSIEATRKWIPEHASADLARLQSEFPDDYITKMALEHYGATRLLRPGIVMPAIDISSLGDPKRRITNATLAGKTVLIDFWATWCLPCLAEMSTLHNAYEKFHSRGLEIVSISADHDASDVDIFRRDKWPMPWQHGWVAGSIDAPELKALQIMGIPRVVLIGPDGVILAEGAELRGGALQITLERILK